MLSIWACVSFAQTPSFVEEDALVAACDRGRAQACEAVAASARAVWAAHALATDPADPAADARGELADWATERACDAGDGPACLVAGRLPGACRRGDFAQCRRELDHLGVRGMSYGTSTPAEPGGAVGFFPSGAPWRLFAGILDAAGASVPILAPDLPADVLAARAYDDRFAVVLRPRDGTPLVLATATRSGWKSLRLTAAHAGDRTRAVLRDDGSVLLWGEYRELEVLDTEGNSVPILALAASYSDEVAAAGEWLAVGERSGAIRRERVTAAGEEDLGSTAIESLESDLAIADDGTVWAASDDALYRWDGAGAPAIAPFPAGPSPLRGVHVGPGSVIALFRGSSSQPTLDLLDANGQLETRIADVQDEEVAWGSRGAAWIGWTERHSLWTWGRAEPPPGWSRRLSPLASLPAVADDRDPYTELFGRVLDHGAPVAGVAVVRVGVDGAAVSDRAGVYRFTGIGFGVGDVQALTDDGRGARADYQVQPFARSSEADLALAPVDVCSVRVIRPDGTPLPGVDVAVTERGGVSYLRSDADGRVAVARWPDARTRLDATDGDRWGHLDLDAGCAPSLAVDGWSAIEATVVTPDGSPAFPACVRLGHRPVGCADPSGHARITGLEAHPGDTLVFEVSSGGATREVALAPTGEGSAFVLRPSALSVRTPAPGGRLLTWGRTAGGNTSGSTLDGDDDAVVDGVPAFAHAAGFAWIGDSGLFTADHAVLDADGVTAPAWQPVPTRTVLRTDAGGRPLVGAVVRAAVEPFAVGHSLAEDVRRTGPGGTVSVPVGGGRLVRVEDRELARLAPGEDVAAIPATWALSPLPPPPGADAFFGTWVPADPDPRAPVESWTIRAPLAVERGGEPVRWSRLVGGELRVDPQTSAMTGDFWFVPRPDGSLLYTGPDGVARRLVRAEDR